jgi:hypothetical protein
MGVGPVGLKRIKPIFNEYAGADQRMDRTEAAEAAKSLLNSPNRKERNLGRHFAAMALYGSDAEMMFPDKNGDGIEWKDMKRLARRNDEHKIPELRNKLDRFDYPGKGLGNIDNEEVARRLDERFGPKPLFLQPGCSQTVILNQPAWNAGCQSSHFTPPPACDGGFGGRAFQTFNTMSVVQNIFIG